MTGGDYQGNNKCQGEGEDTQSSIKAKKMTLFPSPKITKAEIINQLCL